MSRCPECDGSGDLEPDPNGVPISGFTPSCKVCRRNFLEANPFHKEITPHDPKEYICPNCGRIVFIDNARKVVTLREMRG